MLQVEVYERNQEKEYVWGIVFSSVDVHLCGDNERTPVLASSRLFAMQSLKYYHVNPSRKDGGSQTPRV